MIPRTVPEWFISFLVIIAGISIILTGDARLGAYILWLPQVSLSELDWAWGLLLIAIGLVRVGLLTRCVAVSHDVDGVCDGCPFEGQCRVRASRRRMALANAIVLAILCVSLSSGESFLLATVLIALAAALDFFIWSILTPAPQAIWTVRSH